MWWGCDNTTRFIFQPHSLNTLLDFRDTMRDYPIKSGNYKNIEGEKLLALVKEIFGNATQDGNIIKASYGALKELRVFAKDKKTLCVETVMDRNVVDAVAEDTRKKYNQFLEKATGYTAKERAKKLQKEASKDTE